MTALFALFFGLLSRPSSDSLTLRINPAPTYIERDARGQVLNVDLVVSNSTADSLELRSLLLRVRDASGRLVLQRFVDGNGLHPGIETVPDRRIAPGAEALYFSPFTRFDPATPLDTLEFILTFAGSNGRELEARSSVHPAATAATPLLALPLHERLLVYDGHDYYSHHRRFQADDPRIREFGLKGNFMRFSYDLLVVNEAGDALPTGAVRDSMKAWYGFGKPVFAAAGGEVIAVCDTARDDRSFQVADLHRSALALYGNYVAVRHPDGSIALYGHLRQHSIRVKRGHRISTGQRIAAIGASGSSLFPHLHFELRTAIGHEAEGLPARFGNFRRWLGSKAIVVPAGLIDSGDIISSR
ncbi:M23 family metallopeptidase [Flaviaesturariibacter terrae]